MYYRFYKYIEIEIVYMSMFSIYEILATDIYNQSIKWIRSFKNLPCNTGLMTNKQFLTHVEELQNVDIYHHYLYKYIKKIYPEYT